jgi:hypothetical protein
MVGIERWNNYCVCSTWSLDVTTKCASNKMECCKRQVTTRVTNKQTGREDTEEKRAGLKKLGLEEL